MVLIAMSERDLQRIEVLSKVMSGRMTVVSAAHVLDLSERQVQPQSQNVQFLTLVVAQAEVHAPSPIAYAAEGVDDADKAAKSRHRIDRHAVPREHVRLIEAMDGCPSGLRNRS